MKNTQLIAILVTIATVSAVSAGYTDKDGNYHREGFRPVRNTGRAAGDVVKGTSDVVKGTITTLFGGDKGVSKRMDERREQKEKRRKEKKERREARRNKNKN